MAKATKKPKAEKKVTRYTYDEIKEPRTPETGHTSLLPADEQVVTLPMDNGWSKAIEVGKLSEGDGRPVIVDMDPAADPVLFWAGKRNRREVPLLPLQRNEIVSESRIAQIIERARRAAMEKSGQFAQGHLFADLEKTLRESDRSKRVEFYTHEEGWKNKLICGDSLHVMESLLHYENLRGKVQMVYLDPPYGIKYDSNFQQRVDSTKNDDNDKADDILTIKAFRDTWALGVHSYLSYIVERLFLARELLTDTGSIFFQISDDNLHLVRAVLDEVFGAPNYVCQVSFAKTGTQTGGFIQPNVDYLLWYAKDKTRALFQPLYEEEHLEQLADTDYRHVELADGTCRRLTEEEIEDPGSLPAGSRVFSADPLTSDGFRDTTTVPFVYQGKEYHPGTERHWGLATPDLEKLGKVGRIFPQKKQIRFKRFHSDFPFRKRSAHWTDTRVGGKLYKVQTGERVVARCILMTTQPGDLVFDPTCGSGTTAFSAEMWGRRWITCDTARVAINVTRQRLVSAIFPHFVTRNGSISSGFKCRTAPQVTAKGLATGMEPAVIDLLDQPETDKSALRVCGPFEVTTLGRYSVEDWKGYVVRESVVGEATKLENYIETICRLYRKNAAIQGASGLVHAVAEAEKEKIAISIGPLSGRVTAKQINDAVQDALASGLLEVHVLGWAFEANVGEVKSALEKRGKVKVELIMIRPDTLAEGLKVTQPDMLFSPLALPDIEVTSDKAGKDEKLRIKLKGVALFDRKRRTTEYKRADSGYVSAWYLDEDYDGDCFVDCQMFFDFKKAPNIKAALRTEVEADEFSLKLDSEPFPLQGYKRIAVKVVDVYGNESTIVRDLA